MRSKLLLLGFLTVIAGLALGGKVRAAELEIRVTGLSDAAMADNVRAHVGSEWVPTANLSTTRRREAFRRNAELRAAVAMRPYGYYSAGVVATLERTEGDSWTITVRVQPGEPVRVRKLNLQIVGEGQSQQEFGQWRADWPLQPGARLDQVRWEELKRDALDLADSNGFLSAEFAEHRIDLDLPANAADLTLVLDTGPRAVMGEVDYHQQLVKTEVLVPTPRFRKGDPYLATYVDVLRTDLWRTGYFEAVEVTEDRHLEQTPPVVDLQVNLTPRKQDTHQTSLGYGSDSKFRIQYRWNRHWLSDRGDSLAFAAGWQQRDNEELLSGEYRLPRLVDTRQYWSLNSTYRSQQEDLNIREDPIADPIVRAEGRVNDFLVRGARVRYRDLGVSREQLIESAFVQYLAENDTFSITTALGTPPSDSYLKFLEEAQFTTAHNSITIGMDWDWPVIQGHGFHTTGHHERAWAFTANGAWGSDRDFSQVYLGSRWNVALGERWKLLLRAEAGWSDATVKTYDLENGDGAAEVSITDLPYLYRFKAGGSSSVRGYGFEELSDSGIGANNLLTGSAELEFNFRKDWSVAAFYDVGNAFNNWNRIGLKRGAGIGLRWYTVAGSIRLDYARALDFTGEPWRIHFTIGTPLL